MKTRLTITDLTRMQHGHVCIAGYTQNDSCVRPVFRVGNIPETWLSARGRVIIRPFAEVEFELGERRPEPPHTEDRIVDRVYRVRRGHLGPEERVRLLERILDPDVAAIFAAPIYQGPGWYLLAGTGSRSLGTVRPAAIHAVEYTVDDHRRSYHLGFTDAGGGDYSLSVTDLAFRYFLDTMLAQGDLSPDEIGAWVVGILRNARVFLRIGLSRHWEKYPDRCFLQCTGVHAFPDYLDGRCFADFAPLPSG